jgi:hypothetical protein
LSGDDLSEVSIAGPHRAAMVNLYKDLGKTAKKYVWATLMQAELADYFVRAVGVAGDAARDLWRERQSARRSGTAPCDSIKFLPRDLTNER